jgi:outer membrane protein TolC
VIDFGRRDVAVKLRTFALMVFFAVGAVLFSFFPRGLCQDPKVLTLKEAMVQAMQDNRGLKAKKEKIGQSLEVKNRAQSGFLPKLGLEYSYVRVNEAGLVPVSGGGYTVSPRNRYEWRGTLTQPLFTGFALTSSYRLAELGIDQSEMEYELAKLDLALQVKEAYFNILAADKAVEVAEKEVISFKSSVNVAKSFYEVGMIPINDLLKAEVEHANAEQGLVAAKNASRLARSQLNRLLSRDMQAPVEIEDLLVYKPEIGEYRAYLNRAMANRPEIKLIDIALLQTDQQIRLAKSDAYPEVSFQYQYFKEGDSFRVEGGGGMEPNSWLASAGLKWTFWEWGKTHYATKEKEGVKKELLQERMSIEDRIALDVQGALLELDAAEKNIPTTRKAVEQGEENLRVNEERYKAQVTTITEVLDAQTLLTRARVSYYRALYNHNLGKARLQRALGEY